MRKAIYIMCPVLVLATAFWAYVENERARQAVAERQKMQRKVGAARETLELYQAEWAYLTNGSRLRMLAEAHHDELRLEPIRPEQVRPLSPPGGESSPDGKTEERP